MKSLSTFRQFAQTHARSVLARTTPPALTTPTQKPGTRNLELAIQFRGYQQAAFDDRENGIEVWLWGRQTGKSFTLAAWAVDRLIQNPGRLVTILSNSKSNGMELNLKCAEICRLLQVTYEQLDLTDSRGAHASRVPYSASPPSNSFNTDDVRSLTSHPSFSNQKQETRNQELYFWSSQIPNNASPVSPVPPSGGISNSRSQIPDPRSDVLNAERKTLNAEPPQASPNPKSDSACEQLDLSSAGILPAGSEASRLASGSTRNQEQGTRNSPVPTRNQELDLLARSACLVEGNTLEAGLGSQTRNRSESSLTIQTFHYETRITINGVVGRIKVLPANPRTARGFSGDLILDEFAFHENSAAIWEAAEPILAANPDYLCRVASTPNGRHNMFYRLATNPQIPLRKVARSDAYAQGLQIFHPVTREPITPEQARDLALDKRAYDQNYECLFETENMALLTYELILAAERENIGLISHQSWSPETLPFLLGAYASGVSRSASAPNDPSHGVPPSGGPSHQKQETRNQELYLGIDVGRSRDLTVITVLERCNGSLLVRAILRMHDTRLPDQQEQLAAICRLPGFRRASIDMTGLGLGLFEYTQKQFGSRIRGINFSSHLPLSNFSSTRNLEPGTRNAANSTAAAPEVLALGLLAAYEDRRIQHPIDEPLREDLRKPERIVNPSGRVSIAASRDGAGHADHFWSLALAVHAAQAEPDIYIHVVPRKKPFHRIDRKRLM